MSSSLGAGLPSLRGMRVPSVMVLPTIAAPSLTVLTFSSGSALETASVKERPLASAGFPVPVTVPLKPTADLGVAARLDEAVAAIINANRHAGSARWVIFAPAVEVRERLTGL